MEPVAPAEDNIPAPAPSMLVHVTNYGQPNAVEEIDVVSDNVSTPEEVNIDDAPMVLPDLPSDREMEEFFNIAD